MERFSQRESVLLGYSPQSQGSLMNNYAFPKADQRSSDIDFNDVFGGPPRLSSIQETRCSYSEGTDDSASTGDDGAVISRHSWNGLREKPVFREEGFNRRRYTSENFFDDIFKGNESLSSSPRKRDGAPYCSSPGSQVLSPVRPPPPKADPFGTSLPARFSLPAKLTKGMELPTFGSAPRSPNKSKDVASNSFYSFPLSRSSNLNKGHEERNDNRSSHYESILSREFSLSSKESSNLTRSAEAEKGAGSKKELNSSEVLTSSNQFHFSIYKWASKGVPLVMPLRGGRSLRSRVNNNTDRCSSSDGWKAKESELSTGTLHETKLSLSGELPNARSFVMEHSKQKNSTPPDTSTQDRVEMQPRVDAGDEEIIKKATENEIMATNTKKAFVVPDFSKNIREQDEKRATLGRAEVGKGSQQGSPMNSRDPGKIGSKGRVKDFIKIFNQEGLSKSKISVDSQSQSPRWRSAGKSKAEKEANFSKIGTDENSHKSSGLEKKSSPYAPTMVNQILPHSEKQQSSIKNTFRMPNGTSGQKDNSSSESIGNASKAVIGDTDESFLENFLVKELLQGENKLPRPGKDPEDIQAIDGKIRKWANGKDRNIRSLLSTLQYVLWSESGWKTVPLVDIIEGSAVKRSYQKALLCLHPDKLQQKGSTSEQKYIAEKVFDILQDAWTNFNSLGSL